MRILAICIFVLASCGTAHGKCSVMHVAVSGSVAGADGIGIPDAIVAAAWTERGLAQGPVIGHTDEYGRYQLDIEFNPVVGGDMGDSCTDVLRAVSVSAVAPGFARAWDAAKVANGKTRVTIVLRDRE